MEKDERRKQLSEFLRTRRARLTPHEVGLPSNGRRRTPGLRREEVALLAGVGVDWYTWLEQGRDINVSEQVLTSIARTLHLNATETQYLFTLARESLLVPQVDYVSPAMQFLLDNQGVVPALILGRYWDVLAWNQAASVLYGGFEITPPAERNMIWMAFNHPLLRGMLLDWEGHMRRTLAQFRFCYAAYPGDPRFQALIERMTETNAEFRKWWPRHDVISRVSVCKEFDHPVVGRLVLEQAIFQVSENPDLKFVAMVPVPDTPTLERMQQLVEAFVTKLAVQ